MILSNETKYDSTNDTLEHKAQVQKLIAEVLVPALLERGLRHDDSKLYHTIEREAFDIYTPKLKELTYGTDEYKAALAGMKPALDNHYANNSHHPEHYDLGMAGMDLVDILEMIIDWYAATKRHTDGDIMKSIELNKGRFGYNDMLMDIFKNTVSRYLIDK